MSIRDQLLSKRNEILQAAQSNGVRNIRIFGSVARGEDNQNSDIDFLVEFEDDRSLFDLIRFKQELENMLGKPVDVVTENSVHQMIRPQVMKEAVEL
ncbi:MAG TPA: nucleotidyltransferase family protein [Bacillales bacterium]